MALHGKKYSGDLYGRKYGTSDGFEKLGNVTELTTSKDSDNDELLSTGRDDYGEAIEIETIPGSTELSLKFNTFDKHALARALMGEAVDLDTSPTNFSDGELTVALGWLKLSHSDIDVDTLAITDSSQEAVDPSTYDINPRLGMIRFNSTSTLQVGDTVTYTGKTKGRSGFLIDANTLQSLPLELYLDGRDRITGKDGTLIIPHAVLSADGDINWFNDDWWESGLSGKLVKDEGKPTMRFMEFN